MKPVLQPLRILVVAPLRYPIRQPHAGGLESSIWHQVTMLRQLGHTVTLCAVDGSDFMDDAPDVFRLPPAVWADPLSANDIDYPAGYLDHALPALERALDYVAAHSEEYDVVHNHSLNGTPLAWAGRLGVPMLTTLHTPVLPDLLLGQASCDGPRSRFISVSAHTAAEWAEEGITSDVTPNAIDADLWPAGPGGTGLVWFGRIVREKAPHLAVLVARSMGLPIVLAGRVGDPAYAEEELWPLLGDDAVFVGALGQLELASLVGASACALVTPVWEEPFGLVIAEALTTGTPVVSFDAGGISEVVRSLSGARLVAMGDLEAMQAEARELIAMANVDPRRPRATRSRAASARRRIRAEAVDRFSLRHRMRALVMQYRALIREHPARASDAWALLGEHTGSAVGGSGIGGSGLGGATLGGAALGGLGGLSGLSGFAIDSEFGEGLL